MSEMSEEFARWLEKHWRILFIAVPFTILAIIAGNFRHASEGEQRHAAPSRLHTAAVYLDDVQVVASQFKTLEQVMESTMTTVRRGTVAGQDVILVNWHMAIADSGSLGEVHADGTIQWLACWAPYEGSTCLRRLDSPGLVWFSDSFNEWELLDRKLDDVCRERFESRRAVPAGHEAHKG